MATALDALRQRQAHLAQAPIKHHRDCDLHGDFILVLVYLDRPDLTLHRCARAAALVYSNRLAVVCGAIRLAQPAQVELKPNLQLPFGVVSADLERVNAKGSRELHDLFGTTQARQVTAIANHPTTSFKVGQEVVCPSNV